MRYRQPMAEENQVDKIFTPELKQKADALVAKYETKRASILMILRLIQDHYGHISREAQRAVASYLELPEVDVYEVMTFYTLFYEKPRAKTEFHMCRTLTCSILGGAEIVRHLEQKLGIESGGMTPDGEFSVDQVECLGACELAPMMQLNEGEYIGHLTPEKIDHLIEDAKQGKLEELKKAKKTPL